jgi:hypothetical protein
VDRVFRLAYRLAGQRKDPRVKQFLLELLSQ